MTAPGTAPPVEAYVTEACEARELDRAQLSALHERCMAKSVALHQCYVLHDRLLADSLLPKWRSQMLRSKQRHHAKQHWKLVCAEEHDQCHRQQTCMHRERLSVLTPQLRWSQLRWSQLRLSQLRWSQWRHADDPHTRLCADNV